MSKNKNILAGYSGHAHVVADAAILSGIEIYFYSELKKMNNNPFSLKYLGNEFDKDFQGWGQGYGFILGIGDNKKRSELAELILSKKENLVTVKHPKAVVSNFAKVGRGTFIGVQSCINAFSEIGDYAIINTNSIVEHDCKIGDGVHIAPGAVLAGGVKIGEGSFIGANAVVREGVTIGKHVVVGAGSIILQSISDGKRVVGNPGREI